MSGAMRRQDRAIFSAVSSLSPVSIHTLMPEINGCTRAQTVVDALRHVVLQLVLYRSAPDQKQLLLPFGRQLHYYIMAIYYWECV